MYKELFEKMLELQDGFNKKVHPDWKNQNFDYDRAIWVEAAECMDHIGYKWWKYHEPDKNQAIMELVDIYHFGMSSYIKSFPAAKLDELAKYVNDLYCSAVYIEEFDADLFRLKLDELVFCATNKNPNYCVGFSFETFFTLWHLLGQDIESLYKTYIGKNALNEFRQLNGYKDGSYIKMWYHEVEDNQALTKILSTLAVDNQLYDNLLTALATEYNTIKGSQS